MCIVDKHRCVNNAVNTKLSDHRDQHLVDSHVIFFLPLSGLFHLDPNRQICLPSGFTRCNVSFSNVAIPLTSKSMPVSSDNFITSSRDHPVISGIVSVPFVTKITRSPVNMLSARSL